MPAVGNAKGCNIERRDINARNTTSRPLVHTVQASGAARIGPRVCYAYNMTGWNMTGGYSFCSQIFRERVST
jgi:hypothetical protein